MTETRGNTDQPAHRVRLRVWPGATAAVLIALAGVAVPAMFSETALFGVYARVAGGLAIVGWWAGLSRAPWSDRVLAITVMAAALGVTSRLIDESIATAGMGMMFYLNAVPVLGCAFVVWAVASRPLSRVKQRVAMVATILLACGAWTLVRSDGMTGDGSLDLVWRWSPTAEERLLARTVDERAAPPAASAAKKAAADWPGFRGPERDGVVPGVQIETDWTQSPPTELWRRPIGPGISSFAVAGDLLYTQEQRGEDEVVSSYRVSTGVPVWTHRDPVRFWDSHAGAGPRSTPTLHHGRVYTFGATGLLNALDAADGAVAWSRDVAAEIGVTVPYWGFASSPLVVGDTVIVAASGRLVGYDRLTGDWRWSGPTVPDGESYSSPHLMSIDGVEQVLVMSAAGASSVAPASGTVLWEHSWPGAPIVQPASLGNGEVLLTTAGATGALGLRRIAATHGPGGWAVEERWTSNRLKPYFNDFVVHEGHAYGFDGSILACVDLETGERRWKGGRYGHGQLMVLTDQDLLLVLSEQGEVVLVSADPAGFTERARLAVIEGKTWNHPVLVGDVLLVRNGREMAAFRIG